MPYVSENASDPTYVNANAYYIPSGSLVSPSYGSLVTSDRIRNQYGWRSKGESQEAYKALEKLAENNQWKDTRRIIEAMDRVERAMRDPVVRGIDAPVHKRYYTEEVYSGAVADLIWSKGGVPFLTYHPRVAAHVTYTPVLSESEARNQAGSMLRQSRPTYPHANLGQFVAELRDSKRMFKHANYDPRTPKQVGGSNLNIAFGILPGVRDIQAAAQAVVDSEDILRQFLLDSNKLVERRRKRVIDTGTYKGSITNTYGTAHFIGASGRLDIATSLQVNSPYSGTSMKQEVDAVWIESLRTFATFEYFAFDPDGFLGRLNSYSQRAHLLLGATASADVAWEVTPYSWLMDWYYDIGGLLSYQESVASDSLAARRCGFVHEILVSGTVKCTPILKNPSYNTVDPAFWLVPFSFKDQTRLPGTPYDMGISWSGFSSKRAFILGSLGLTWLPGLPIS